MFQIIAGTGKSGQLGQMTQENVDHAVEKMKEELARINANARKDSN